MATIIDNSHYLIPEISELTEFLEIESCAPNFELISKSLLSPLSEFLSAQGKKFREDLIEIGFLCAGGILSEDTKRILYIASQIIEGLHAGSMIVDDIQDQSEIRRGKASLHRKYGIAVALNAGNWLYFQALDQIRKLKLTPSQENKLQHYFNKILLKAHFGQALDVGVQIATLSQQEASRTCFTAMELKTGALMSLAYDLGSFIAKPSSLPTLNGSQFAKRFGVALQMFDDIGNFISPPPKGKEDIQKGRPSFIWAIAAQISKEDDYRRFVHATRMLPDESFIASWAGLFSLVPEAKKVASQYLWKTLDSFQASSELQTRVRELMLKLERSYV